LECFFRGVGFTFIGGYGLTETTGPITVNAPRNNRIGSVGLIIPGSAMKIADDGEIFLRGTGVSSRYHNSMVDGLKKILHMGWFATGDLGSIDNDGFVYITGRKKEIIVTSGGKNVIPTALEDALNDEHMIISNSVAVGDNKPYIAALVTLDPDILKVWLKSVSLPEMEISEARTNPRVLQEVVDAVTRANSFFSRAEAIKKICILDETFGEDNGYLTPTQKIKRDVVMQNYGELVERMYAGEKMAYVVDTN
jgi:long-chain acyl-CoA synthetase